MPDTITEDQVVQAAQELQKDEFTRADVADRLSVERPDIKEGLKSARDAGRIEKTRNDDEGTGHFRLAD